MQEEPFCLLALKVSLQGKLGLTDLPFPFILWNFRCIHLNCTLVIEPAFSVTDDSQKNSVSLLTMLELECVATYIHVLHSTASVSKTPLTGVQRHKSRRQKKTRSLCEFTCSHHIRLSSTALLNTCRLRLRGFLQGLQTSSVSALELCCC